MIQSSLTSWLKKPLGIREPAISIPLSKPDPAPRPTCFPQQPVQPISEAPTPRYRRPTLPPNVTLSPITSELIPAFKRVNQLLLAIPYPKKFYTEILEDEITQTISRVALWHDSAPSPASTTASVTSSPLQPQTRPQLVAAIRCRLLGPPGDRLLYISTLTCLSPFRGHGLATALLVDVMARAVEMYGVKSVTAHVWEANEEGREWYRKRGFVEESSEAGYYKKLKPMTGLLVRKTVVVRDLIGADGFVETQEQAANG